MLAPGLVTRVVALAGMDRAPDLVAWLAEALADARVMQVRAGYCGSHTVVDVRNACARRRASQAVAASQGTGARIACIAAATATGGAVATTLARLVARG